MLATQLEVRPVSRLFKALGDETRLRIVALLAHGELCVCHIQDALELPQPTASRHLGVLRSAGVVEPRREGAWIYYSLAEQTDPECQRQLNSLVKSFAKLDLVKRDVEKLVRIRGPDSCR